MPSRRHTPNPDAATPCVALTRLCLGVIVAASGLTGCTARRSPAPDAAPAASVDEGTFVFDVPLRIENRFYGDVVLSIDRSGVRTRLTTITGNTSRDLVIPRRYLTVGMPFRLIAEGIGASSGGERLSTNSGDLLVRPGQRVVWQLEAQLQRSSAGVY